MATIAERYTEKFAKSMDWYQRGMALSPGGRGSQAQPGFSSPICFEFGKGPYKYDVDDNEIIEEYAKAFRKVSEHANELEQ